MGRWLLIELGGSSAQTAERNGAEFRFTNDIVRAPERPVALACPGLIRDGRVWYATNLGWPQNADPREELGIDTIALLVNDAEAAALGEAVLRGNDSPSDLYFIGLGTGVGSAAVRDGAVVEWNLGHCIIGGDGYCEGCQARGCLNAYLAADRLPNVLEKDDQRFVAQTLAQGIARVGASNDLPIVLAGGIARRYPAIRDYLAEIIQNAVEQTAAPSAAKSAAYAGLDYLAQRHYDFGDPR